MRVLHGKTHNDTFTWDRDATALWSCGRLKEAPGMKHRVHRSLIIGPWEKNHLYKRVTSFNVLLQLLSVGQAY